MINLPANLGIGGAVQTGYKYARLKGYDIAVQVDADGQHDPAFLGKMADAIINEHADMVIGSRFLEKKVFSHQNKAGGNRLFYRAYKAPYRNENYGSHIRTQDD